MHWTKYFLSTAHFYSAYVKYTQWWKIYQVILTHTVAVWCVHVHTLIFKVEIIKNRWGWKVLELSSKSKMFEGFR